MDHNEEIIVDFVLPASHEASNRDNDLKKPHALKCGCGSMRFALASEMKADAIKGVPASRMYECMYCGEYHLG